MAACHGALLGHQPVNIVMTAPLPEDDDLWFPCRNEPTVIVATGCVHEHVRRAPACASCAAASMARVERGEHAICWPCRAAGCDGCPVLVAVEDLPAAAEAVAR